MNQDCQRTSVQNIAFVKWVFRQARYVAMKNSSKIIFAYLLAALLIGCQNDVGSVEYVPLVWNGDKIVENHTLLTKEHLNNVEHVLRYYGVEYKRASEIKLIIKNGGALDRDTLWNYTSKANNDQWLNSHSSSIRPHNQGFNSDAAEKRGAS